MKKITFFLLCSLFVLTNCQKVKENCEYTPDFDNLSESLSESLDGIAQIAKLQHKARCKFQDKQFFMNNNTKNCLNCGHESHCGKNCYKNYGESEKTLCCTNCRCEKDSKKDILDIDSFNGA